MPDLTMKVSLEEFGKKAAEFALHEITYNGMTIKQWADKIASGEFAEVRHGRFIEGRYPDENKCSECGQIFRDDIGFIIQDDDGSFRYPKRCPECGCFWDEVVY